MSNHIENLKISNFKCFKELEVSNIGRVNLIGGKNNVGKTSFLEAVELFVSSDNPLDLFGSAQRILKRRQHKELSKIEIDFIYDSKNEVTILSPSSLKEFSLIHHMNAYTRKEGNVDLFIVESISIIINDQQTSIPIEQFLETSFSKGNNHSNYIAAFKADEQDIAILFGLLIENNTEDFLNNALNLFDENIIALKQIVTQQGVLLKLKLKDREKLVLLSSLGEGINRYIAILCAIWASKDSVLLIDEIENGIHYTNYKKLWQIIFQASVDANCQLFITTHSKECISAFNEVQLNSKYESCNSQYFEFYRNLKKDGIISASQRDKEQLQYSLSHNGRIRGE